MHSVEQRQGVILEALHEMFHVSHTHLVRIRVGQPVTYHHLHIFKNDFLTYLPLALHNVARRHNLC